MFEIMKKVMLLAMAVSCVNSMPPSTYGKEKKPIDRFGEAVGTSGTTENRPTLKPTINYSDHEYSCLNATTVVVKAPTDDEQSFQEVARITCPISAPWCEATSGTCVVNQPPSLEPGVFTCMRDGLFPDVDDCQKYYQCVDGVPLTQECPSETPNYVPYRQSCFSGYDSYCADYYNVCEGFDGVKKPISYTDNLFAYCDNGTVLLVDKCMGKYHFSEESQTCHPRCPHSGLFPGAEDCAQYYRCSPVDSDETVFNMTFLSCPEGQGFLEDAYGCVDSALVPNCQLNPEFFT